MDVIRIVFEKAEKGSKQKHRRDWYCVVDTIDVKNASSSASWEALAIALHDMRVLEYLCRTLKNFPE